MCAPSKALNLQSVKIRSTQRLTTSVELTIALQEVTNVVKPVEGTYQAATQVKVLSPEIFNEVEADVLHYAESGTKGDVKVSCHLLYRGRRPWHGMRWKLSDLGKSSVFLKRYAETSQQRRGLADDAEEVGLSDSTLSMGKPCTCGSGQQCGICLNTILSNTQMLVNRSLVKYKQIVNWLRQLMNTSLKSRVRENRKHGSVGGIMAMKLYRI